MLCMQVPWPLLFKAKQRNPCFWHAVLALKAAYELCLFDGTMALHCLCLVVVAFACTRSAAAVTILVKVTIALSSAYANALCLWSRDVAVLLQGGTVVNHDRQFQADVLIKDGLISAVESNIKASASMLWTSPCRCKHLNRTCRVKH
jgi:hypothetical protein